MTKKTLQLVSEIKSCVVCEEFLPFEPKPIFSFSESSKIVLIGQAPGIKVHESEVPWADASGKTPKGMASGFRRRNSTIIRILLSSRWDSVIPEKERAAIILPVLNVLRSG